MPKPFVCVRHETQEASAEAVAAGLRSQGIPAIVERDDDLLAVIGPRSSSRFAIVVPGEHSRQARRALGETGEPEAGGQISFYLSAALLFGMLAAAVVYVLSRLV